MILKKFNQNLQKTNGISEILYLLEIWHSNFDYRYISIVHLSKTMWRDYFENITDAQSLQYSNVFLNIENHFYCFKHRYYLSFIVL